MLKTNIYDHTGKKLSEVTLPESLFGVKVSKELMSQAIHVYRSNSHQGFSKVQGRGEVDRTTAKWYKQKGTGRARHGARSAPIFVGGGAAFGPRNINRANLKLTQKMKRIALLGAFSSLTEGQVTLVSGLEKLEPRTKALAAMLSAMTISKKPTLLVAKPYANVISASANVKSLNIIPYSSANAYLIMNTKSLIIDESAIDLLKTWLVVPNKKSTVLPAPAKGKALIKDEEMGLKPVKKPAVKKTVAKKS